MANPLHDNERSKSMSKEKGKEDERKGEEKKMAERAKPEEKEPEGDGEEGASAGDKFAEGMKKIEKRHEGERRDAHGNHREMLRQMAARHSKEIADHFEMHAGDGDGGGEGEGEPPAGGGAPTPAPAAPPEE